MGKKEIQSRPSTELQGATPAKRVQVAERWASMTKGRRKREATELTKDPGKIKDPETMRALKGLLESYLLTLSRSSAMTSDRTIRAYWTGASRLLAWCSDKGHIPHQMASDEMVRFKASLSVGLDGSATKPKTQQIYMSGAKAMIGALRWVGLGEGDPFIGENGKPLRVYDPNSGVIKHYPYKVDEIKKLLAGANDRERAIILLGADGGLRLEEMQQLKWKDIDFKSRILKFTGKGSKDAKVRVSKRAIAALKALKGNDSKTVFKISRRRMQQIFTRLCEDVGVTPRGIHNLRHTCGTRLYELTRDLLVVKRHLRHSSTVTSEIYAKMDNDYFYSVLDKLETNGYA